MASPRETSIWNKIRKDLSESQQLILNGRYNDAMILNKNILATIVQLQLDKAVLVSNTLESDVDQLYDSQVISDETHQKYVKIVQYGSQAEAGAMPTAQAANDSFSLLRDALSTYFDDSQPRTARRTADSGDEAPAEDEAADTRTAEDTVAESSPSVSSRYTSSYRTQGSSFDASGVNIPISGRRTDTRRPAQRASRPASSQRASRSSAPERPTRPLRDTERVSRTGDRRQSSARPSSSRYGRNGSSNRRSGSARRRNEEPVSIDLYTIAKIAIPIACVILGIILIRVLMSGGKSEIETTPVPTTEIVETTTVPETEPVTEPETTAASTGVWMTTTGVKVRTAPNTTDSRVLAVVNAGTVVNYKSDYDADWIVIDYEGQEAYMAKQYVQEVQAETTAGTEETTAAQ